jgi:hypothetical protein
MFLKGNIGENMWELSLCTSFMEHTLQLFLVQINTTNSSQEEVTRKFNTRFTSRYSS